MYPSELLWAWGAGGSRSDTEPDISVILTKKSTCWAPVQIFEFVVQQMSTNIRQTVFSVSWCVRACGYMGLNESGLSGRGPWGPPGPPGAPWGPNIWVFFFLFSPEKEGEGVAVCVCTPLLALP